MNRRQFYLWIGRIYETRDFEIDCDQFQQLMPAFTDVQVNGANAELQLSQFHQHMEQCPDCADEYASLYRVAVFEADGGLPTSSDLIVETASQPEPGVRDASPVLPI